MIELILKVLYFFSSEIYASFFATSSYVPHSKAEPRLVSRKTLKCLSLDFAEPSAMFDGIETAHLFIWFVRLNISNFGKAFVINFHKCNTIHPDIQFSKIVSRHYAIIICPYSILDIPFLIFHRIQLHLQILNNKLLSIGCILAHIEA